MIEGAGGCRVMGRPIDEIVFDTDGKACGPDTHFSHMSHTPLCHISEFNSTSFSILTQTPFFPYLAHALFPYVKKKNYGKACGVLSDGVKLTADCVVAGSEYAGAERLETQYETVHPP